MFTIELENDLFPELMSRIESLDGKFVDAGYWAEQGTHYSGFTYVGLAKYLSGGNPKMRLPPRNFMQVALSLYPVGKSPLKDSLKRYLSELSAHNVDPSAALQDVGDFYRDKMYEIMGDDTLLASKAPSTKYSSASPNTPLVERGDLKSKVASRVNGGEIREHG